MVCIDNVHLNIRQESTCCCLLESATNGFEWALSQQRVAHGLRLQAMVKTEMITAETRYEETIEPESSNSSLACTSKSEQCDSSRKIYFPEKEEGDFTDFRSVDCIPTSPQAFGCPKTRNRMRIPSAHERKYLGYCPRQSQPFSGVQTHGSLLAGGAGVSNIVSLTIACALSRACDIESC